MAGGETQMRLMDAWYMQLEAEQVAKIKSLEEEIARLRLTDAEREAIERLCEATNESIADDKRADGCHWQDDAAAVAVVRGLLERHGGER